MPHTYNIKEMSREELDIVIDWAAAEGWNPGLNDADCFYAADPQGFLIGLLNGEPIAAISAVQYGASFGFVGLYLVKPEYRGQGFGIQIWNAALARLEGRVVGLDGVVEQQANYQKSGFDISHRNVRYQGITDSLPVDDAEIVPLSSLPFDDIYSYDKCFFPDQRRAFLSHWIKQLDGVALGILQDHTLAGYGVLRSCRSGFKIGPLFADTPELAERLFRALCGMIPVGREFFLDIPATNAAAVTLAERHKMNVVFETSRMYKGKDPQLPLNRIFGITTFELG